MLGIVKPLDTLILPQMDAFFIHLTEENNIYARMFCRSFSCIFYTSARMGILQFRDGQACIVLFVENIRAKEIDKQREGDARKAPDPAE